MNNKFKNILLICILMLLAGFEFVHSQVYSQMKVGPQVYYRFFKYPLTEDFTKTGLRMFIQAPYNDLLFIKEEDFFTSNYEIEIVIHNEEESIVLNESFEESFSVVEFDETNSDSSLILWEHSVKLEPNEYEIEMIFTDKNSKKTSKGKIPISIQKFDETKINISDILFLERIEFLPDGEVKLIPSHKNNSKIDNKKYFAYFEMYSPNEEKEVKVRYALFDEFYGTDEAIKKGTLMITKRDKYDYFYTDLTDLNLEMGRYLLTYEIIQGEERAQSTSAFSVGWEGLPQSVAHFDEAIDQMKYIASGKEMKNIKNKKGNEKLKAFKEYWDKKEPTPGIGGNKLMIKYYQRINYAKRYFANARGSVAGWLSDRGYIYVLMGGPDEIYTQTSSSYSSTYSSVYDNPHETWYYYDKRREYTFIDETGFGDYKLISPIYYEDSDVLR